MPFSHRPGHFRQENKKHKVSGHQSKRAKKLSLGAGRVDVPKARPKAGLGKATEARKKDRVNHAIQIRRNKKEEVWLQKRLGSNDGPPKVCVWVSLSAAADPGLIELALLQKATTCTVPGSGVGMVTSAFNKFKQRMTFLRPGRDLAHVLNFAKVADLLLLVLPVGHGTDGAIDEVNKNAPTCFVILWFTKLSICTLQPNVEGVPIMYLAAFGLIPIYHNNVRMRQNRRLFRFDRVTASSSCWTVQFAKQDGDIMMTALKAAGLPAVVGVLQGLEMLSGKKQADMRKWGQRFFDTHLATQAKSIDGSNTSLLLRTLCTVPTRRVHWRSVRSYILPDIVEIKPLDNPQNTEFGTLCIRGYIRGRPLDVNQLVHLGELGHFRIRQVNSWTEPCPLKTEHRTESEERASHILAVANPDKQEDTNMEAEVDGLAGEQTWPTDQELAQAQLGDNATSNVTEAALNGEGARLSGNLPPGCSGYQAAWFVGTEDMGEDTDGSEDGDNWELEDTKGDCDIGDLTHAGIDLAGRRRAEDEDAQFPDEVDTPIDRSARDRFARYRALKSFRTSSWDPKESLPVDYARIFQVRLIWG